MIRLPWRLIFNMAPLVERLPDGLTFAWGRGRHGVLGTGAGDEESEVHLATPRTVGGASGPKTHNKNCAQ